MKRNYLIGLGFILIPFLSFAQAEQCATPNFYPWSYLIENQTKLPLTLTVEPENNCLVLNSMGGNVFKLSLRNPSVGFEKNTYIISVRNSKAACGVIEVQYQGYYGGAAPQITVSGDGLSYSNGEVKVSNCGK